MHKGHGFLVLGSVVLCVTGGEALYADMGHFGTRAIRLAWYSCVFPALLLNYFGQGALLLEHPEAARQPVLRSGLGRLAVPDGHHRHGGGGRRVAGADLGRVLADPPGGAARLPAARHHRPHVGRDRGADLHPRGQLGADGRLRRAGARASASPARWPPRTASRSPARWRSRRCCSSTCAATSGTGASGARRGCWRCSSCFDLAFFVASSTKIAHGGWFPLAVAVGVFTVMMTWKRGRSLLAERIAADSLPIDIFLADIEATQAAPGAGHGGVHVVDPPRDAERPAPPLQAQQGAAPGGGPPVDRHRRTCRRSPTRDKVRVKSFGQGFWGVTAHYGFMESPDVMDVLRRCKAHGATRQRGRHQLLPGARDAAHR